MITKSSRIPKKGRVETDFNFGTEHANAYSVPYMRSLGHVIFRKH